MADSIYDRIFTAQIYALGTILRKSANDSFRNGLDLSASQWPIISSLANTGATSLAGLCKRLSRDKGQLSRDLAVLSERGLIVKSKDSRDSRQVVIDVNRESAAVMAEIKRITGERNRVLTAGLSEPDQRALRSLLSKLYENAHNPKMFDI